MTDKGQLMTTLNEIMSPKSIAIVGASDNKGRIGGRPLAHMIEQKFSGGIFPINPNRDTVQGIKAYPSLLDVKEDLDFILVAVPSNIVVSVIEQAVQKKAKTVLIFSSGFSEIGGQGEIYQNQIKKISQESGLRVIGPNCLGLSILQQIFIPHSLPLLIELRLNQAEYLLQVNLVLTVVIFTWLLIKEVWELDTG